MTQRFANRSIHHCLALKLAQHGGYSLPLVLVIVLVLIAGASTLVARSGSNVFGSVFQKQSWEARSLAEFGMATLVSRLNREENRYLLAAPPKEVNPTYNRESRWTTDATILAANHSNPCADTYPINPTTGLITRQSTPPQINSIYPGGSRDGWWYINTSGQVTTSSTNAVGKFRLIGETGDSFRMGMRKDASIPEELDVTEADGKSAIKLSVEAILLNSNGSDKARAVLEEVLDIVPKCCKTTFGNDHGSNNYRATYSSSNPFGSGSCVPPLNPDSFGVAFGISGDGGLIKTSGNATEVWRREDDGTKTIINPVACIQTGTELCRIEGTFNKISGSNTSELLEVLNTAAVPKAPEWYPGRPSSIQLPSPYIPLAATGSSGNASLSVCRRASNSGNDCRIVTEVDSATTPFFRYCMDANCSRTIINGNASPSNLPSHCKFSPSPPNGDGALHCVVSRLNLGGGGGILQFASGILPSGSTNATPKPIRIYFAVPSSSTNDYLIDQGGSTVVEHCVAATANLPNNSTDLTNPNVRRCRGLDTSYKEKVTLLSMLGCNPGSSYYGSQYQCLPPANALQGSTGAQYFKLQGNASSLGYFSYFPYGNIELQGNADVEGVIWPKNIQVSGSGDFIVPASGVNEALELLGINPGPSNDCSGSIAGNCSDNNEGPPKWDFVARSVRRFTFKFG